MKPAPLLLTLLAAASLAACTPMRWDHPNFGAEQTQADLGECGRSAYYEAQRQAFFYSGFYGPYYPRYYRGRAYYDPFWFNRQNDYYFRETQLRDYCMRNKGYSLVPVPES